MLVSIITPSYNQGSFIRQTIESVVGQSHGEIEYLIYDACSTDETADILDSYRDHPRVTRIVREKDRGQTDAINKGFRAARGEIVGWINSDDLLPPDIAERAVAQFERDPEVGLTYCDIEYIEQWGHCFNRIDAYPRYDFDYLLNSCYTVFQPGSFYRKSVIEAAGYLNDSLQYCMDLDLWLKILARSKACHLPGVPSSFRWHQATKTVNGETAFLVEIMATLGRHGASRLSPNMRRLFWYYLKTVVRKRLTR